VLKKARLPVMLAAIERLLKYDEKRKMRKKNKITN